MTKDEITVKVQQMFPNCQKYNSCCSESGTEEMMKKFDNMNEEPIKVDTDNTNRIKWKKKRIVKRKPPKGFEGW